MAEYRKAQFKDVREVAPKLSEEDVREVEALGYSPLAALADSYFASTECMTILNDAGEPVGMFGYADDGDGIGADVWMLASREIETFRLKFLRESRQWIDRVNSAVPLLYNYVDARNERAIRWLRWLGFVFIRERTLGPDRTPFILFVRTPQCV